jgi:lipopolysaccharide/colanic/teichoic acid biosynthesis glycosyltransferase
MENSKQIKRKNIKGIIIFILIDILIVFISFLFFAWLKPATVRIYLPMFAKPFFYFEITWVFVSLLLGKYNIRDALRVKDVIIPIIIANATVLAIITTLMYSFGVFSYSRLIVFGTLLLSSIIEISLSYIYFSYRTPVPIPEFDEQRIREKTFPAEKAIAIESDIVDEEKYIDKRKQIKNIIIEETGKGVYRFIAKYIDVGNPKNLLISTTTQFNIDKLPSNTFNSVTNLHNINDIRRLNKFFEAINSKIPFGGVYINSSETFPLRKERLMKKYPPLINHMYYFFDFIFTRVFPKLPITKNIYFFITMGRNRVISRAETLGRLYSCGFECIEESFIDGTFYFVMRKTKEPYFPESPTYGPFIRLQRYGKGGKLFGVYKMRTMHAYSEYLQEYVYQKNSLQEGGKFSNDFRITAAGRFMRKFWLDELPMIFNVLKGEMKVVGVRPLSKHYFNLYSEELKTKRLKYKPGLVPPFYADMPVTLDEIMKSEMDYLDKYENHPFLTDINYFFKAFYNIIFKRARSN